MDSTMLGNRFYRRARVPVEILRSFGPTEPKHMATSLPPLDGEEIKSGMVITADAGNHNGNAVVAGFRIAQAADNTDKDRAFFIALHDADAHDVQFSGAMLGFLCGERLELQTGYFAAAIYAEGTWLTAADGGRLTPVTDASQVGIATVSAEGPLVGGSFPGPSKTIPVHVANAEVIQVVTGRHAADPLPGPLSLAHEGNSLALDGMILSYQD